ncbi:MAG: hypothetical protein ABI977_03955, partial [Acidobacteriota bacterium]
EDDSDIEDIDPNFFEEENLQVGKEIIDGMLADDGSKYIQFFRQVRFEKPDKSDWSATTRYKRHVLVYRALLALAGFKPPQSLKPDVKGLFVKDLLLAMQASQLEDEDKKRTFSHAAGILAGKNQSWSDVATALGSLYDFMKTRKSGYQEFEEKHAKKKKTKTDDEQVNEELFDDDPSNKLDDADLTESQGDSWADKNLEKLLTMFSYPNGSRQIGKAVAQHTDSTTTDYAVDIYKDLVAGKLVIVDQSSGDPEINKSSADRIMWHIFRQNQILFRQGTLPPDILVYIEEAHNLLPTGSDMDLKDVWVRTAKEGAKYLIGMVYATQEVSSIQRNILKNTANWFIGHLNNTDETKELCKYYDFEDFEASIRRAQDRGFIRAKTLSNLFVVPIQVKRFEV